MFKRIKSQGSATFIMIMLPMMLGGVIVGFLAVNKIRTYSFGRELNRFVTREMARSSFILMEAAMKRRIWEVPPETRSGKTHCAKRLDFGMKGVTANGVQYEVQATMNPETRIMNMLSSASYLVGTPNVVTSTFEKSVKIFDASQFLLFSAEERKSRIRPNYYVSGADSMIAKQRRFYNAGYLEWDVLERVPYTINPNVRVPLTLPVGLSIVLQAERFYLLGGIGYAAYSYAQLPYPGPLLAGVTPYVGQRFQTAGGGVLMTDSPTEAQQLVDWSKGNGGQPLTDSEIFRKMLPRVYGQSDLSGAPYNADTLSDNGLYVNTRNSTTLAYSYPPNSYGMRYNFDCYAGTSGKECSDSNQYPSSFNAWKTQAGLASSIIGSEGERFDFPTLDWDNYQALEEDALECGLVIDSSSGWDSEFRDCDLSNSKLIEDYLASPGADPCRDEYELDFDSLTGKLANLDLSLYSDNTRKNEFLRRVVYVKEPLTIRQTGDGLWPSNNNPASRENLPLWIVSEQQLTLVPKMPDSEDFSVADPGAPERLSELFFNEDITGTVPPLTLAIITPEKISIQSPTYSPYTYAEMAADYPVVAGKLQPNTSIITNFKKEEQDGFKYGVRRVHLNNIALIKSVGVGPLDDFIHLRGLWFAIDSSAAQYLERTCAWDDPDSEDATFGARALSLSSRSRRGGDLPPYACDLTGADKDCSSDPAINSRFYNRYQGANIDPSPVVLPVPHVFQAQAVLGLGVRSEIAFKGLLLETKFDNWTPTSKRDLSVPRDVSIEKLSPLKVDYQKRKYRWDLSYYYKSTEPPADPSLPGRSCGDGGELLSGGVSGIATLLNRSHYHLTLASPTTSFENLGSLMSTELPIVQVSN